MAGAASKSMNIIGQFVDQITPRILGKVIPALDRLSVAVNKVNGRMVASTNRASEATKKQNALLQQQANLMGGIAQIYMGKRVIGMVTGMTDAYLAMNEETARTYAITKDLGISMTELTNIAKNTGDGLFTAGERAKALYWIFSSGITDVDDAMTVLSEGQKLAAISGAELNEAMTMALRTAKGFNISLADTARVVDTVAAGANKSMATVQLMGEAMAYVAPSARTLNMTLAETTAMAMSLFDAGLKASMVGTYMRMALKQMIAPTLAGRNAMESIGISFIEANGQMKSMVQIVNELADVYKKYQKRGEELAVVEAVMTAFRQRGGTAVMALMNAQIAGTAGLNAEQIKLIQTMQDQEMGGEELNEVINEFNAATGRSVRSLEEYTALASQAGVASTMYGAVMESDYAIMKQFSVAVNDLKIALGQALLPVLKSLVAVLKPIAEIFAKMPAPLMRLIGLFTMMMGTMMMVRGVTMLLSFAMGGAGLGGSIGMVIGVLWIMMELWNQGSTAAKVLAVAIGLVTAALISLRIGLLVTALAMKQVGVTSIYAAAAMGGLYGTLSLLTAGFMLGYLVYKETGNVFLALIPILASAAIAFRLFGTSVYIAMGPIGWIAIAIGAIITACIMFGVGIEDVANVLKVIFAPAIFAAKVAIEAISWIMDHASDLFEGAARILQTVFAPAILAAKAAFWLLKQAVDPVCATIDVLINILWILAGIVAFCIIQLRKLLNFAIKPITAAISWLGDKINSILNPAVDTASEGIGVLHAALYAVYELFKTIGGYIETIFSPIIDAMTLLFRAFWVILNDLWEILEAVYGVLKKIADIVGKVTGPIGKILGGIKGGIEMGAEWGKGQVEELQHGGRITKTGIVMAHEGEIFSGTHGEVPIGGPEITINITGNTFASRSDIDYMAELVMRKIKEQYNRS